MLSENSFSQASLIYEFNILPNIVFSILDKIFNDAKCFSDSSFELNDVFEYKGIKSSFSELLTITFPGIYSINFSKLSHYHSEFTLEQNSSLRLFS